MVKNGRADTDSEMFLSAIEARKSGDMVREVQCTVDHGDRVSRDNETDVHIDMLASRHDAR